MVLAVFAGAFPWSLVCFDVLCQIARTFELLAAELAGVNLGLCILFATSHGPESLFVVVDFCCSLHGRRGDFFSGNYLAGCERYDLSVGSVAYQFSWLTGAGDASM